MRPADSASQRSGQRLSWSTKSQAGSTTGSDWSFKKGTHPNDPNSTVNIAASTLTRRNLEKNHEEIHLHSAEGKVDLGHRQRQLDDLKRTLSTLGLDSSDELVERMVPASVGEAPMTTFLAEKHNQTVEEKLYNQEHGVTKNKRYTGK